jgi:hypothetical protein
MKTLPVLVSRRAAVLCALLGLAAPAANAGETEVTHTKIVPPKQAVAVDEKLKAIGVPMSFAAVGSRLVIGGTKGIGAIDASGKLLWSLELPPAAARQVAADDNGVAFTSFDLGNVDRSGAMASPLLGGELSAKHEFTNATVGLVDPQGKLLWSVPSAEQAKLAPPALSAQAVGVVGTKTFALYDRATGKAVGEPVSVYVNVLGLMDGLVSQFPSRAAVVSGDVFHLVRNNYYKRVSATGEDLESSRTLGPLTPLEYVPAGPVLAGNLVVFANSPSTKDTKPLLIGAKVGGGFDWNDRMDAVVKTGTFSSTMDAPMDIAAAGGSIFVATNFSVFSYSPSGSQKWKAKNRRGGLYPSELRGARYIGNAFEKTVPVPKSFLATPLLAATDERVFVTARYTLPASAGDAASAPAGDVVEGSEAPSKGRRADGITVLDAKTGSYVETLWQADWRIIGLALFGDMLAVATGNGVVLVALK